LKKGIAKLSPPYIVAIKNEGTIIHLRIVCNYDKVLSTPQIKEYYEVVDSYLRTSGELWNYTSAVQDGADAWLGHWAF